MTQPHEPPPEPADAPGPTDFTDDEALPHEDEAQPPPERLGPIGAVLALLFRPHRFFPLYAPQERPVLIALLTWLWGIAYAIERQETNYLRGRTVLAIDSWPAFWGAMTASGILGAVMIYAIGGWWYRVRLRWSGALDPDPYMTRRIYVYSAQLACIPLLVTTLLETWLFENPRALYESDGSNWYLLLILFAFWSIWVSYRGVSSVFDLGRGSALVWFAILPAIVYGLVFATFFVMGVLGELDPPARIDRPQVFRSATLAFSYPDNWGLDTQDEEYDEDRYVLIDTPQDTFIRVWLYESHRTAEEGVEDTLEGLRPSATDWRQEQPFSVWGTFSGFGQSATGQMEGRRYRFSSFAAPVGEGMMLEYTLIYRVVDQQKLDPGLRLIASTLRTLDVEAAAAPPQEFRSATFEFSYPGSWALDTEDEDFDEERYVLLAPPRDAFVRIWLYESEQTPEEEVEDTLVAMESRATEWREEEEFSAWGSFTGFGRSATGASDGVRYRYSTFVARLEGGMMLEYTLVFRLEDMSYLEPGLRMIETTLRATPLDAAERPLEARLAPPLPRAL